MVQSLKPVQTPKASPESFGASDLMDGTVIQTEGWTTVAKEIGDTNNAFGAGFGPNDRRMNSQGWSDLDMQITPDGGTTDHPAEGKFRFAVYGDKQGDDLIATSGTFRAEVLRSAVSSAPTEKVLIAALYSEVAGNDSMVALQYKGAENNSSSGNSEDGLAVEADGSSHDYGVALGRIPL